jgi:hypothetical protein
MAELAKLASKQIAGTGRLPEPLREAAASAPGDAELQDGESGRLEAAE